MSEWQPIETAPSQEDVLVCRLGMRGWWCVAWRSALGEWHKSPGCDRLDYEPTHWMDLPTVPV